MRYISKLVIFSVFMLLFAFSLIPAVSAQTAPVRSTTDYTVLAPLPGIGDGGEKTTTLEKYLPAVFNLSIGLAAAMAFVAITLGGITYATSDALSGKQNGRDLITNAVWGLLLVIAAWIILYTINPKILTFNLTLLKPPATQTSTSTSPVVPGGSGNVGCQGTCPYSYTNTSGDVVKYKDCSSCTSAASFGLTLSNPNVDGKAAQIDTVLGERLKNLQTANGTMAFRVTETWPPTVNHAAQGQYDGTSADVSLVNPTSANIMVFISNAQAQGLRVVYEVSTPAQKQAYVNAGVPEANIISVGYITGEHFSVYKN